MGATSGTGSPAGAGAGTPDGAVSGEPGAGYSLGVWGPAGWGSTGLGSVPEAPDVESSSPVVAEAPAALAVTGPDRSSCGSEETG